MNVVDVLTAAGTAALVSSLGLFTNSWLERRARIKEIALARAMELADFNTRTVTELAHRAGLEPKLYDRVVLVERYYTWLLQLVTKGSLPEDIPARRALIQAMERDKQQSV